MRSNLLFLLLFTLPIPILSAAAPNPAGPSTAASTDRVEQPSAVPNFEQLLDEAGMQLTLPADFEPVAARANPLFLYDHAVRAPEGGLEIRYAVRPLARLRVDYDDPHGSAPDPNHIFPLMFQSVVTSLSGGGHSPTQEYPPERAKTKFNADWAAASVFDVVRRFKPDHGQALLVAMHKNRLADAYAIFLFDDYEQAKPLIDANLAALSFRP